MHSVKRNFLESLNAPDVPLYLVLRFSAFANDELPTSRPDGDPDAAEIRRRCLEIQAGWDKTTEKLRRQGNLDPHPIDMPRFASDMICRDVMISDIASSPSSQHDWFTRKKAGLDADWP